MTSLRRSIVDVFVVKGSMKIVRIIVIAIFVTLLLGIEATAQPLVRPATPVHTPTKGLQGRHIALWQSHGYYFEYKLNRWEWQRARMFQTVEDLYTQSYVLPFLVPMLENSGATVMLPRERDLSRNEYIIDNDSSQWSVGSYNETGKWESSASGFGYSKQFLRERDNLFRTGTARVTQTSRRESATATWRVQVEKPEELAVYIAYQSSPEHSTDALYTVHHAGGESSFHVNQQMGGGTWIYLGSFPFDNSDPKQGVTLSNKSSKSKRLVTADGVKIGGGMGNVERAYPDTLETTSPLGITLQEYTSSGYPRYCEAARYWLQWAGVPDTIYSPSQGLDDYTDDYRCRAYWVNYLLGGTSAIPDSEGLNIPIDLVFAFHTDAGTLLGDSIVGTLGIYNSKWNEGLYPDGSSRESAREFTDIVMTRIVHDVEYHHSPEWVRRDMWDKSYSEATHAAVPSMLLELLSHQNFSDMRYGLDPEFRFTVSRAIYKGILQFLAEKNGFPFVVQPLPVKDMLVTFKERTAHLSWNSSDDPLEPSANPDAYIIYTSKNGAPFDGGRVVNKNRYSVKMEPDVLYRFKVVAVNAGGSSFPSEILAAGVAGTPRGTAMVVNGFTRVSAPDWVDYPESNIAGFVSRKDGGVPYLHDIAFIGYQKEFDRSLPWVDDDNTGFGDSHSTHEKSPIAGNSFDYPAIHGSAILKAGFSFASSSASAVVNRPELLDGYDVIDLILGKQKQTDKGPRDGRPLKYKALPKPLRSALEQATAKGSSLLVSGAYVASDLWHDNDPFEQMFGRDFANNVLHIQLMTQQAAATGGVTVVQNRAGLSKRDYQYNNELSQEQYVVESPDGIVPTEDAVTLMRYSENNIGAAVGYYGDTYSCVTLGFPLESIRGDEELLQLMNELLTFLTKR